MAQVSRNRGEHGNIAADTKGSQSIVRGYFQDVYFIKLESLKEMDELLSSFKQSKLNLEEINNSQTIRNTVIGSSN